MENAHQPSCPGNLLASLLTYQLHQDQQVRARVRVRVTARARFRVSLLPYQIHQDQQDGITT